MMEKSKGGNRRLAVERRAFTAYAPCLRDSGQDAKSRKISGYAILFGVPSVPLWDDGNWTAREVIAPEAVSKELLDGSDIKFTMFHDRTLILARSRNGSGTLSYGIDGRGVWFEFEAPDTADGDKALELVRRGDLSGCSFAFTTEYRNTDFVERKDETKDGRTETLFTVKRISGVHDFTLAADPAYPETSVEARELTGTEEPDGLTGRADSQIREMRQAASEKIRI